MGREKNREGEEKGKKEQEEKMGRGRKGGRREGYERKDPRDMKEKVSGGIKVWLENGDAKEVYGVDKVWQEKWDTSGPIKSL
ncbi:hypothetical protein Pcinc_034120 [Petrolisthes cinctipes]|uniref:Uncharacterized protein n=1 Tax=Petrolisthes cinctipes TaxID=88211 RepID=A0AAE1EQV2_PETCI|nr:hypothetical protein Pcinc_034120 [Petrolisthes cinctipes]